MNKLYQALRDLIEPISPYLISKPKTILILLIILFLFSLIVFIGPITGLIQYFYKNIAIDLILKLFISLISLTIGYLLTKEVRFRLAKQKGKGFAAPITLSDKLTAYELAKRLRIAALISVGGSSYYGAAVIFDWPDSSGVYWTWLAVMLIMGLDWLLLSVRVRQGWYGSNGMEAMEIVRYVERRERGNGGDNDRILPRRKARFDDNTASVDSRTAEV
jgi:hypothetical protein